jgi:IMP dehydrogenase
MPQLTAIMETVEAAGSGLPVIADGGIKYSGDLGQGAAAGSVAMVGRCWRDEEIPARSICTGRSYKAIAAWARRRHGARLADRYSRRGAGFAQAVPEGVRAGGLQGTGGAVLHQLPEACAPHGVCRRGDAGGVSGKAEFVRISGAGLRESHAHDVTITRESPNYPGAA